MVLGIFCLLFGIALGAFLIYMLTLGAVASLWWSYLLMGVLALALFFYGLYKLEDETGCFSILFDSLNKRLDERDAMAAGKKGAEKKNSERKPAQKPVQKKPSGAGESSEKGAKKSSKMLPLKGFGLNIALGCLGIVLLAVYLFLYVKVKAWLGWEWLDWVLVPLSFSLFLFAGVAIVTKDHKHPVFGGYHPSGKTIKATKAYIEDVYLRRGYQSTLRRIERIFTYIYILMIGIATLIDASAFPLLPTSLVFFFAQFVIYDETTYKEYIAEIASCKDWERYVCKYCDTLISGNQYEGRANESESSSLWRETTTTTTTTTDTQTIGDTVYVDTYVDTDVSTQDYIRTDYQYDQVYRCPRCKKLHYIHKEGSYRTWL